LKRPTGIHERCADGEEGAQARRMTLSRFMADQLRKPSGWFGSAVMTRMLGIASRRVIRVTIDLLRPDPEDAVLDIGFGGGDSVLLLGQRTPRGSVTGVDFSPEMVAETARRVGKAPVRSRVRLCVGDASNLPFQPKSFDRILAVNTAYFWPDLTGVFTEVGRVMKPRGRFAVAIRPASQLRKVPYAKHGFNLYGADQLTTAMEACGMRVVLADHVDEGRRLSQIVVIGERGAA